MWAENILSVFATGLVWTQNILCVFKFIGISVDGRISSVIAACNVVLPKENVIQEGAGVAFYSKKS